MALLLSVLAGPAEALADGAFPNANQVLLRPDRPGEILVSTNFGLLVSVDDGRTFRVLCEEAITPGIVSQYQLGPAPDGALYASGRGLHVSSDDGCHFTQAGGTIAELTPTDVWPDPTDARRVFALGFAAGPNGSYTSSLFPSLDGGRSFGAPLLAAAGNDYLSSVENARSQPSTLYAVRYSPQSRTSTLLRSLDGGARFTSIDTAASAGTTLLRIAAVDPERPGRLFLRAEDPGGADRLLLSDDGGDTLRVALKLADRMTTLLRRADGSVLVAAADGSAYRSRDGGESFVPWPGTPHLRGLGERGGRLYAVADPVQDGYVVAVSDDEGASFRPLLRYTDLCGPLECAKVACARPFEILANTLQIVPPAACSESPAPVDAAVPMPMVDAAIARDMAAPMQGATGCGCGVASRAPRRSGAASLLLVFVVALRDRRMKRRREAR